MKNEIEMTEKNRLKIYKKIESIIKNERKTIPKQYNKVNLLDYLFDSDIDMMTSITTRGDGKTYGYLSMLIKIATLVPEFKFMLVARHYTLRTAYWQILDKIVAEMGYNNRDVAFKRADDYIQLYYKNEPIALITDLNNATDLKYHSNVLKDYRLLVYDEFLAIDGDYLPDEPERLKTIYESVERGENHLMKKPKILLLGNPVNFNSPLLAYFGMFDMLEKQPMNTIQQHGNIVLERYRNDSVNNEKNNRLFSHTGNTSVTGEFKVNRTLIAPESLKSTILHTVTIKLQDSYYLYIHYVDRDNYYLAVDAQPTDKFDYCTQMIDFTDEVPLLDDTFYSEIYLRKHNKGRILFADTFSLTYFDRYTELKLLNINRLINRSMLKYSHSIGYENFDRLDKQHERSSMRDLKARLFRQYELI